MNQFMFDVLKQKGFHFRIWLMHSHSCSSLFFFDGCFCHFLEEKYWLNSCEFDP